MYLIKDAEERGLLTPGEPGIIVESTAGNTGISLAEVAASRGYKCVIVIPKTQSQEKKDALRYAGAELVEVPAKPYSNPNNYVKYGARLAEELGALYTGQFDNRANRAAHVATTGPEIWAQLKGKIDGFSCAIGTGGTLAGTAEYLRSKSDTVKIALTDPCGAKLVRYYNDGVLKAEGDSITEGIGQGRVTGNLEGFKPDYAYEIPDEEVRQHGRISNGEDALTQQAITNVSFLYLSSAILLQALEIVFNIMQEEGMCLGTSSGINVAGAIRFAKELGPGHTIVTVLCDLGTRYTGKLFNASFLAEQGLPQPEWLARGLSEDVASAVERTTIPDDIAAAEQAANAAKAAQTAGT